VSEFAAKVVPPVSQQALKETIVEYGSIYYSPGQGGNIVFVPVPAVSYAAVLDVRPVTGDPIPGTIVTAYVRDWGLGIGSVAQAIPTDLEATVYAAPNAVRLVVQSTGVGYVGEGIPPVTGTVAGTLPIVVRILIKH
jgi:hypothetical protein